MNWSRGLFRAWIVLSVVWVGFVLAMTWREGIMASEPASVVNSALLLPAALLAIGWTGLWIGRGFRRH
jgi:hypothetical protein